MKQFEYRNEAESFDPKLATEAYRFPEKDLLDFIFGNDLPEDVKSDIIRLKNRNNVFKERLETYEYFIRLKDILSAEEYNEITQEGATRFAEAFDDAISHTDGRESINDRFSYPKATFVDIRATLSKMTRDPNSLSVSNT